MALTSTITLSSSSVQAGQTFTCSLLITNGAYSPQVTIVGCVPTCQATNSIGTATSFTASPLVFPPNVNNVVGASGSTLLLTFPMTIYAPALTGISISGTGTAVPYTVGATITSSDGSSSAPTGNSGNMTITAISLPDAN